jgi:hypothetical protein
VIPLEARTEAVRTLEQAGSELRALAHASESEVERVVQAFEGLTSRTDSIMNLAAAMVGCVANDSVRSVLPNVETLGAATRRFIIDRMEATSGILGILTREVQFLRDLSAVTRGQSAIALETKALSLLTNIEVDRLGPEGASFRYLAGELAEFSRSMLKDTLELTSHTETRRAALEETQRVLAAELPRQREEMARIQADLGGALAVVHSSLTQLSGTPGQFRMCVEDVARQIAGVVAAVQAHDITRQQMDHVEQSCALIVDRLRGETADEDAAALESARAYAGLTIQVYQLRAIKDTVAGWAAQIRTCIQGILRVSANDVVAIGPLVREHERELSAQLEKIETLQHESQAYSDRIQTSLGGLSNLMQLVTEHLRRSKAVRGHLQLLTFNSIIEAGRLGEQAVVILAIAESIKGMSADWGSITRQTEQATKQITSLVGQTNQVMKTFAAARDQRLDDAQAETQTGLGHLRDAVAVADRHAREMMMATGKMQAEAACLNHIVGLLDDCFAGLDAVLNAIDGARNRWEVACPELKEGYDAGEVEKLFSGFYTTEIERRILRAALEGAAPPASQTFEGNSVELF